MRGLLRTAGVVLALALAAQPAAANNALVPAGTRVPVARTTMSVVPPIDMNRLSARPGRQGETWTLDGTQLNRFLLVAGVADGQPMLREREKKDKPLPRFDAKADGAALFDFYSGSLTAAEPGVAITLLSLAPAERAGCAGVLAEYRELKGDDGLERRGRAFLCVRDGRFHALSLSAPELHYFGRDRPTFEALLGSLSF